jgi:hypothetical protein
VSAITPVAVASAGEAELAASFANAQTLTMIRAALANLGHPQPRFSAWGQSQT